MSRASEYAEICAKSNVQPAFKYRSNTQFMLTVVVDKDGNLAMTPDHIILSGDVPAFIAWLKETFL